MPWRTRTRPPAWGAGGGGGVVSTVLDLLGSLLIVLGVALFVASWSLPAAFAVAGALVLLLSLITDRKGTR